MSLQLRPYRSKDLDAVIEVFQTAVQRVASKFYTPAQIAAWAPDKVDREGWAERRASRPTWVVEVGGKVVGFSDLEPDGYIDMLFTHADFQGRGVARLLLTKVEAEARLGKMPRLYTEASHAAKPVFAHYGFQVLAEQTVAPDGQPMTNFLMEKRLS